MTTLRAHLPLTLTTERLVLTTPTLAHAPAIAELANNRRIYDVMARLPFPYTLEDAHFFIEQVVPSPAETCYAILHNGTFMGIVGLSYVENRPPELGYWLGQPYWGHGYATEAAQAVTAAARRAGAPALRSRALLSNAGSRNVLKKVGFVETGESLETKGNLAGSPMMLMALEFTP